MVASRFGFPVEELEDCKEACHSVSEFVDAFAQAVTILSAGMK